MDNTPDVADQVGIFGVIATFLLGLFGIHRQNANKLEARFKELDEKKADREDVDAIRQEIRDFAKHNHDHLVMIMNHLFKDNV